MYSIQIADMGCGRCVEKISKAIVAADADAEVSIDLASGQAKVESVLPAGTICALLEELGYPSHMLS